jgi:hypothetical protein
MNIGIDFDNTIANYDHAFYQAGVSLGWVPKSTGISKQEVKSYLINHVKEEVWTELQGIVYGKQIERACLYDFVAPQIEKWLKQGHTIYIVSHKTMFPVIGERISLHDAAMNWLKCQSLVGEAPSQIKPSHLFFNQTKTQKIEKIGTLNCDVFIDDLPSIFENKQFPPGVKKIWFNPHFDNTRIQTPDFADYVVSHWRQLSEIVS